MVCALPSWSTNSRLCAICNASPETVDNLFHVERADIKVRLQEIPSGWLYRIRLKIEQNCRLFWDILSSAIMNDLFMTFTIQAQGGCQMCLLAVKLDHSGKLFWDTLSWLSAWVSTLSADWVHGYLYFQPGAWIWKTGFRRYLHIVKNWSGNFSLNSTGVRALGWPLLGLFFPDFSDFIFERDLWDKSLIGNI